MPTVTNQKTWQMRLFTRTKLDDVWSAEQSRLVVSTNVANTVTKAGPLTDYRRLIAQRESATTPLTGEQYSLSGAHTQGSIRYQRSLVSGGKTTRVGSVASGCVAGASNIGILGLTTLSLVPANNQALNRLVSQISDSQREIQSLVCLGELGETGRYIRSKSQGLYNGVWSYLDSLKRRARKIRRRSLMQQMIADAWLEYQYAIKPTISDIQGAAQAVAKIVTGHSPSKRVIGQGSVDRNGASGFHPDTLSNHWTVRRYYKYYELSNVRYTGSVSSSPLAYFRGLRTLGLTPGEVLGSVWELLPWSFFFDYFTNIQEILESIRWHVTDLDWCEKGVRRMVSCHVYDVQVIPILPGGWRLDYCSLRPGVLPSSQRVLVTREKYLGSLTPSLEFEIPGLSTKWLNIIALNKARLETSQVISRMG